MRNLKRALSLALASVMVLGMMVVGSSAAGYKDVSSEQNQEAIEVLQAVGIMVGDENGNFNPDANVTRNEMAVIMSNLLNLDYDYYRGVNKFSDVPEWAAPYVAACAAEGVTSGIGGTLYGGSNNVTASQAALMLMKALGYFQYSEDFGEDWTVATIRQASYISLFDGVKANAETALTRNQVAQMVLNALEADMVEFTGDVGSKITLNGAEINIGYRAEYSTRTSTDKKYNTLKTGKTDISNMGQYYIQLGEELYDGDLTKKSDTDDFARPATTWRYKSKDIGTYADTPDVTYTKSADVSDIYADLGLSSKIEKANVEVYENGVQNEAASVAITKTNDDDSFGGNGVLTEVFYDDDDNSVIIVLIHTYVGQVSRTVAAKGNTDAYVEFDAETRPDGVSTKLTFDTEEEFEDDAYVLYTYSEEAKEVKSVELAEAVTGTAEKTINKVDDRDENNGITLDGTAYKMSKHNAGATLGSVSIDNDYTVYLDKYGYVIFIEEIEEIGDYALVLATADKGSFVGKKAELLFTDGTTKVVTTDKDYSSKIDNFTIVTYKEDDGVYTLKAVNATQATKQDDTDDVLGNAVEDFKLTSDKATITTGADEDTGDATVTSNSKTVFVVRDPGDEDEYTAYTGIKNAPSIEAGDGANEGVAAFWYCKSGKMVTVMFIFPDSAVDIEDDNSTMLFLAGESASKLTHTKNMDYFEFNAIVNGEVTTVKIDEDVVIKVDGEEKTVAEYLEEIEGATPKDLNGLFKSYSVDKYGVITKLTTYDGFTDGEDKEYLEGQGIDKRSADYTVILDTANADDHDDDDAYTITVDDNAKIYYVDEDGEISVSAYRSISKDYNDKVYAIVEDYLVKVLVIEEVDDAEEPEEDEEVDGIVVEISGKTITVTVDEDADIDESDIANAISDKLEENGYANIDITVSSGDDEDEDETVYTVTAKKGNVTTNFTVTVTVNDNEEEEP